MLLVSCGDDDPTTVEDNPCNDADATCLTLQLAPEDVSYISVYNPGPDNSQHAITWSSDQALSGYAPGQHITITVNFTTPVEVHYTHESEVLTVTSPLLALCYDRSALPDANFESSGWTNGEYGVECLGECTTGESRIEFITGYSTPTEGDELRQIKFDFVVPATYTSGANAGQPILPGDLTPIQVQFVGTTVGNTVGVPPVYPGEYTD
jgi:hypothetical protein